MGEILVPLHLLVLAFTLWHVVAADHLGFTWMRGKAGTLDPLLVSTYHNRTWAGLIFMIITGIFLFIPQRDYLLSRPQFWVKMGFVLALVINSFAISTLQKTATTKTFNSLSFKEKLPLLISGVTSTLSWIGATMGGFFLYSD